MSTVFRFPVLIILACMMAMLSCTSQQGIFSSKRSPHAAYRDKIEKAGLATSAMGVLWLTAAEKSLQQPASVNLPYQEKGYFPQDAANASGYRFSLRRGEQAIIRISTVPATGVLFFTELWKPGEDNKMKLLASGDTAMGNQIIYEAVEDASYIVRIQPELLRSMEYNLTITTGPSLAFPVRAADRPQVTSFWGADRDGGRRSHEGVDIFAKKHTPLIAAADGTITRVNENNLGGKVVFLRPEGKNYSLYYAHLDSQLVSSGQQVKTGEVIGLMGNTGNARTTGPHLHFGIYSSTGAIDPLPFIEQNRPALARITADSRNIHQYLRTQGPTSIYNLPSTKATVLKKMAVAEMVYILAATENWYKVIAVDGQEGFIASAALTASPWKTQSIRLATRLLDEPVTNAPAIRVLEPGQEVSIIGKQENFYRVKYQSSTGWVQQEQVK